MPSHTTATTYARLSTWQARSVLIVLAVFLGFGVIERPSPPKTVNVREEGGKCGDVLLYCTEIERMHAGETYYNVAGEELVTQGYPTKSVFNWRTPLPMWLIARMPTTLLGKIPLLGICGAMTWLAYRASRREEPNTFYRALPLVVLLVGASLPAVMGYVFVMPVVWAGAFITLSLCAFGDDRPLLGAVTGVAAVFFRDLALPYCLLGALLALVGRRWKELFVWVIGLMGWAAFFAFHWWQVQQHIRPGALAHHESWVQFGGLRFVLATLQGNPLLFQLPVCLLCLYFAAAMLGLAGWNTAFGRRVCLTVCLYAVAFAFVGQDFNRYWGMMTGPAWCFGAVLAPRSIYDLWIAAKLPTEFRRARTVPMT